MSFGPGFVVVICVDINESFFSLCFISGVVFFVPLVFFCSCSYLPTLLVSFGSGFAIVPPLVLHPGNGWCFIVVVDFSGVGFFFPDFNSLSRTQANLFQVAVGVIRNRFRRWCWR